MRYFIIGSFSQGALQLSEIRLVALQIYSLIKVVLEVLTLCNSDVIRDKTSCSGKLHFKALNSGQDVSGGHEDDITFTESSIYFRYLLPFSNNESLSYFRAFTLCSYPFSGSTDSKIAGCQSLKCKKGHLKNIHFTT